jgi:hypothetical protein
LGYRFVFRFSFASVDLVGANEAIHVLMREIPFFMKDVETNLFLVTNVVCCS